MEELRLLILRLFNDGENRESGLNYDEFRRIYDTDEELVMYSREDVNEEYSFLIKNIYLEMVDVALAMVLNLRRYKITRKGELYLNKLARNTQEEKRRNKLQDDLNASVIDTNLSFRNLNENVIPRSNRLQRNLTIVAIGVAALSFFAIAISAYYQGKSVTGEQLLKLNTTLKENNRLLDSMQKFQKGIDSSLRIKAISASGKKKP